MENAVTRLIAAQYDGADNENRIGGRTTLRCILCPMPFQLSMPGADHFTY